MTGKQTPDIDQKLYAILNRIGEMYPADSSDFMTGKQRIRDILKRLFKDGTIDDVAGNAEKWEQISVDQALDSIEEVFKDCLGEREKTRPEIMSEQMGISVRGYDPEITPRNNLRVEVLGRWESK